MKMFKNDLRSGLIIRNKIGKKRQKTKTSCERIEHHIQKKAAFRWKAAFSWD